MSSPVELNPSRPPRLSRRARRRIVSAAVVVAVVAAAGCSGDDDAAPAPTVAAATTTTEPPTSQQQVANLLIGHLTSIGMAFDEPCLREVSDQYSEDDAERILEAGVDGTPTLSDEGNAVTDAYLDCLAVSFSNGEPTDEPADPTDDPPADPTDDG